MERAFSKAFVRPKLQFKVCVSQADDTEWFAKKKFFKQPDLSPPDMFTLPR